MQNLFSFNNYNNQIPLVDSWNDPEEYFVNLEKDSLYVRYLKDKRKITDDSDPFPYFNLSKKRAYNNDAIKLNLIKYLNYFVTFYDVNKELLDYYYHMKFKIDYIPEYSVEEFYNDMRNFILSPYILQQVGAMNDHNCRIELLNIKNVNHLHEGLRYDLNHMNIILFISVLMRLSIPLLTHFMNVRSDVILNSATFLTTYYDFIFELFDIDIKRKLIATAENHTNKSVNKDRNQWINQGIRGYNPTTYTIHNINNIVTLVLPKCVYNNNVFNLISACINHNINNDIVLGGYDYEYTKISNNKRNENEFDKFEITLTSSGEANLIYSQANSEKTLEYLSNKFPIDESLIDHYYKRLTENGQELINPFQEKLIFNLFYPYYGECISIKNTNTEDYVRLMLIAKEILHSKKLNVLAEIISSKVISVSSRKDLNRKLKSYIDDTSELYQSVMVKYNNDERLMTDIRSMLASCITSEFEIIDPNSPNYGSKIAIIPQVIIYQLLSFILLI